MRNITGVLLGIIVSASAIGQVNKKWHFQLDFGTTLTVPFMKTEENSSGHNGQTIDVEKINYSSEFGYFAEIMASHNLNPELSLLMGGSYSNKTFEITSEAGLLSSKGTITTSHIRIPLQLRYNLMKKIPVAISFGPYLSVLTGANEKGTLYLDTANMTLSDPNDPLLLPETNYSDDIKENFEALDYGLTIQLDYEILVSKKITGMILTRFNYGLTEVIKEHPAGISSPERWKNYNFDIGVGIKI